MENTAGYYQSDPRSARGGDPARYPRSPVRFPAYLKLLDLAHQLPPLARHRLFRLSETLPELFDRIQPGPQWGSPEEIAVLRRCLMHYCGGIDGNPHISPTGRALFNVLAQGFLKSRLRAIRFYDKHRDFITEHGRFAAPVIITGFPRTGTTLLHRLLSEDPNTRAPCAFELERPVPPLRSGADPQADARLQKSEAVLAKMRRFAPGLIEHFSQSHPFVPLEREESLFYVQMHNGLFFLGAPAAGSASFRAMHAPETAPALFAYERNLFTMMDAFAPAPSHWTLKAPAYAPVFGALFEQYPDARVIVTHRHPARAFASVSRLLENSLLPCDKPGAFDRLAFGALVEDGMAPFLDAPLARRAAHPERESQIADCAYTDLVADPIGTVRTLYARFGLDYTPAFEERMRRWLAANPQGRHGRHSYAGAEYGLDPARLAERFAGYYARHGFSEQPGAADGD